MAHPYEVRTRLTAEESVAFRAIAESKGVSQSSLIRMQIKEAIAKHCAAQDADSEPPERERIGYDNVRPFNWKFADR